VPKDPAAAIDKFLAFKKANSVRARRHQSANRGRPRVKVVAHASVALSWLLRDGLSGVNVCGVLYPVTVPLALTQQLLLELVQGAVARQDLRNAGVWFAVRSDSRKELSILQLNTIH
jgi:hypothetical protein